MEERTAESIADLIAIVHEKEEIFFDPDLGPSNLWYRGLGNVAHDLLPGVLRQEFLDQASDREIHVKGDVARLQFGLGLERKINRQFRRECVPFFPSKLDLEDTYFISQHHGLPTRLLDWTTSHLTALFFAVCRGSDGKDGCVHILSPLSLVRIDNPYGFRPDFIEHDQELMKNVIANLYDKEAPMPKDPLILPVLPEYRSERLRRQNSRFTLHMHSDKIMRIEDLDYVKHVLVRIPNEYKCKILVDLHRGGIHWGTLFPDLDHTAMAVRTMYRLK